MVAELDVGQLAIENEFANALRRHVEIARSLSTAQQTCGQL